MFGMGKPKFKTITNKGKTFLYRFSIPFARHSIKFHLIVDDDVGEPHLHPWSFTSFLLLGAYKEIVHDRELRHLPFSLVRYDLRKRHKVVLYRIFGYRIPCVTVGIYSKKAQPWCDRNELCDLCGPLGYCIDKEFWQVKEDKLKTGHNASTLSRS